jgi:hypothetical protein
MVMLSVTREPVVRLARVDRPEAVDDARRAVGEEDHYGEEDNTPEAQAELVRGPEPARWLVPGRGARRP